MLLLLIRYNTIVDQLPLMAEQSLSVQFPFGAGGKGGDGITGATVGGFVNHRPLSFLSTIKTIYMQGVIC